MSEKLSRIIRQNGHMNAEATKASNQRYKETTHRSQQTERKARCFA